MLMQTLNFRALDLENALLCIQNEIHFLLSKDMPP